MLVITCEMLFVFLLFRFAQHLFRDPKLGLYTALLYAFLPQVLFVGAVEGKYESLTFIFFISALWLTLQKRPWLAALIIGVGLGFKYSVALIILPAVLLLLKKQKHSWRQIAILTFMPFCVLVLILSPFLILSPDTFLQYTIGNFVQAQEFPARIAGLYNDTPGYHAISIWGALRDGLGIIAPPYLPYLCQLGIVAVLAGMLIRAGKKRTVDSNGKVK